MDENGSKSIVYHSTEILLYIQPHQSLINHPIVFFFLCKISKNGVRKGNHPSPSDDDRRFIRCRHVDHLIRREAPHLRRQWLEQRRGFKNLRGVDGETRKEDDDDAEQRSCHGSEIRDLQRQSLFHRRTQNKNLSYKLGLTRFADLTNDEYRSIYLGAKPKKRVLKTSDRYEPRVGDALPASVDWRKEGVVAAVKDQGSCGKLFPIFD